MARVTTGTAPANGVEIAYETFGDPSDPTMLLVMGLGAQLLAWDERFCHKLVEHGFHVVRYDNRDVGRSTWLDTPGLDVGAALVGMLSGETVTAPYLIDDMADDAAALLDHLGIDSAHVVGASMGGMISQALTIKHPNRVRSLTSIMSTTGDPDVGQPRPEVLGALLVPRSTEREAAIEGGVAISRAISSPDHFDEDLSRARATAEVDRGINPEGTARQLLAIVASPSRAAGLAGIAVPTLVVHGRQDPLVTLSGGERTAELVPGAELIVIDDMAHDVPLAHYDRITDAIVALARRADAVSATDVSASAPA